MNRRKHSRWGSEDLGSGPISELWELLDTEHPGYSEHSTYTVVLNFHILIKIFLFLFFFQKRKIRLREMK